MTYPNQPTIWQDRENKIRLQANGWEDGDYEIDFQILEPGCTPAVYSGIGIVCKCEMLLTVTVPCIDVGQFLFKIEHSEFPEISGKLRVKLYI